MAWWGWLLLGWMLLAIAGAVALGLVIRTAERRDHGQDRPRDEFDIGDRDAA